MLFVSFNDNKNRTETRYTESTYKMKEERRKNKNKCEILEKQLCARNFFFIRFLINMREKINTFYPKLNKKINFFSLTLCLFNPKKRILLKTNKKGMILNTIKILALRYTRNRMCAAEFMSKQECFFRIHCSSLN